MKHLKVIVSGGGTGGHIFPALAIANEIRATHPDSEILFVGALGKMEMEKVPAAGYQIVGLPVAGFQRRLTFKNITFFYKLISSLLMARKIIKVFKPDVVVGVGGYASGPLLRAAVNAGIPALVQEQNSFPGVTNRILSKKVNTICVAYENMDRWFPAEKIVLTGNPVRQNFLASVSRDEALKSFGLNPELKTILVIGGSLGARSINQGVLAGLDLIVESNIQVIWQTGKIYYSSLDSQVAQELRTLVKMSDFIQNMDMAYAAADIVISRAGASSISEIALLRKPAVFVPSPNVSEDHQTKNAITLVDKGAARMIPDGESAEIANVAISLLNAPEILEEMKKQLAFFAKPNAAKVIAQEVFKLVK